MINIELQLICMIVIDKQLQERLLVEQRVQFFHLYMEQ